MNYLKSSLAFLNKNFSIKQSFRFIIPKNLRRTILHYVDGQLEDKSIKLYINEKKCYINPKLNDFGGFIPVFYWDDVSNFGDLIGPYLISKITSSPVINIRNLNTPGIMGVGSIIQILDRKGMTIWGSGLIFEPQPDLKKRLKKYNPKILSVRGKYTANCLTEIGIDVPSSEYYGDPALTLPYFYTPKKAEVEQIAICPHFSHKPLFNEDFAISNQIKIIDVQQDVETVIDAIASSSICISTSLHGLIIAQAYNVPWVWLEITDNNLYGNDFKFKDFFSTLDEEQVCHVKINLEEIKNLDILSLSHNAKLPTKKYNEDLILETLKNYLENDYSS